LIIKVNFVLSTVLSKITSNEDVKMKSERKSTQQATAGNERFGASEAVTRPKVCVNLEVLRPSERQWKPRLRQAAGTLYAIWGQSVRNRNR
jgi:hypothetical protein